MIKRPLFWEMFVLLILTGILNQIAVSYNLYWSMAEFDSVVHFLGGAMLSLFFLWFYFFLGVFNPKKRNLARFLLISILGTMFLAVSWEIFEITLGEAQMYKATYPFDTTMDLTMGALGALTACFYGYLKELKRENPPHEQS